MSHPSPDNRAPLQSPRDEETRGRRGKLKIFFGYAAGVGKSFAMLSAARREAAAGTDVVAGWIDSHGRPEVEALLEGVEMIVPKKVHGLAHPLRELELDTVLHRHPGLVLIDDLAHTNAAGSRHVKRWQDVEELLSSGIDVYTTLDVQHIESLNDVVAQITGITVQETVPDAILEKAAEFELVDISPEDLLRRFREGRVVFPPHAEPTMKSFFQEGNLTALRELSLVQAANRLRKDVDAARQRSAATTPWGTRERLLVCVSPSPTTVRLIRRARRMAAAFGAEWIAVAVDRHGQSSSRRRERIAKHLRLAELLGAEAQQLAGGDVAETILEYARQRNVTKIVVGKTAQPWMTRMLRRTVVDALLEHSGDIDIYVIRGETEPSKRQEPPVHEPAIPWAQYGRAAAIIAGCGGIGAASHALDLGEVNVIMIFLTGVVFVATRYRRGPSIFAAIASVLFFDFLFVPPYLTFTVSDSQYLLTFGAMLGIGLLIGTLIARVRGQLFASQQQERRTAALYRLTKQMSEARGAGDLLAIAGRHLVELSGGEIVIFLREPGGKVTIRFGVETNLARNPANRAAAEWVIEHDLPAGRGTDTLLNATAQVVPLTGSQRTIGAIALPPGESGGASDTERRRLFETAASLIALSLEREQSVLEASQAQVQIQAEKLRSSLLSSVSHDLRTPLAAIGGAASSLVDEPDLESRGELLQMVVDESRRLGRLVDNLLDMSRLEAGAVGNKQWHVLEEIVGSALRRMERELSGHSVTVHLPPDLPLMRLDGLLMEQVFVNLLENAARYTPPGSAIDVSAKDAGGVVEIRVTDNGPGLPPGTESKVFDKFFRGTSTSPDGRRGVGLGLAIAAAIVQTHDGTIAAHSPEGGGAEFLIRIPSKEQPPAVALDETPGNPP